MPPPKKLGKYKILEELGRGGFAVVYKAHDPGLNRVVALKVLHPYWSNDPGFVTRFQREAQSAAGLDHPHIVTVYETGEAEGQLYIAMAYLPGRTLRDLLAAEGALPLGRATPILGQVAEALDHAHGQGVVHRDVKPANIMVREDGHQVHATLLDFGLVKALEGSTALTSQGTLLGSPEYMAPEQADPNRAAEVGPPADRYALGVVTYHMLTGRVPFPGNTPGTLNAHEHKPVPPPRSFRPDLPEPAAQALLKMLAKAPAERYPSAGGFVAELRNAPLYDRLQAAAAGKDWAQVLEVGGQIQASDPDYRDVSDWMTQARRQLQRPRPIPTPPTARRQAPRWVWGVGLAGLVVLLGLLCLGLGSLGTGLLGPTPSPTRVALLPTATAASPSPTLPADTPTTRSADGMLMVYVPDGTFQMGSDEGDPDADEDEKPPHPVTLDAFWIDRYEVSNEQFARFVQATDHRTDAEKAGTGWAYGEGEWQEIAGADWQHPSGPETSISDLIDHPVVQVSWNDAQAYCAWVGGRLPTEAEWEYAARGPDGPIYPWGDTFECSRVNADDETSIDSYVVPGGAGCDGYERTAPVGSFPTGASWVDAQDMAGNVWEWIDDWYDSDYYANSPPQNPRGPETGSSKVLRGGSWDGLEESVRAANRDSPPPDIRFDLIGFRCVVEPGS
jgi:serine/threonine-protein kinase